MDNDKGREEPDPKWVENFEHELEHMIQHGLNLMTIAIVAAREVLFGDDEKDK